MTETYRTDIPIEDQAADAALRAIALYKAARWRASEFSNLPTNFWRSTAAAVPAASTESDQADTAIPVAEVRALVEKWGLLSSKLKAASDDENHSDALRRVYRIEAQQVQGCAAELRQLMGEG